MWEAAVRAWRIVMAGAAVRLPVLGILNTVFAPITGGLAAMNFADGDWFWAGALTAIALHNVGVALVTIYLVNRGRR